MEKNKKKLKSFKKEIRNYLKTNFGSSKKYFCLIYGSYCYNLQKDISDIDLVLVIDKINKKQKKKFSKFVIHLHKKYGLDLDDEVPHIIKTTVNYKDLESCLNGDGFLKNKKTLKIPPIKKTKEFLSSKQVLLRLLLNILTSKCITIIGNKKDYLRNKRRAFETLVKVIFLNFNLKKISSKDFVNFLMSNGKVSGEDYLGYKDKPPIRKYLHKEVKKTFKLLTKKGIFFRYKNKYYLKDGKWLKDILKK